MAEHGPDCPCQRCRGFEPGNRLSVGNASRLQHGAYATVKLGPRVEEIADAVRDDVPTYRPADEIMLRLLALCLARLEAAEEAVVASKPDEVARLIADMRSWVGKCRQILNDLGMSPASRARLGVDVTMARRLATLTELATAAEQPAIEAEQ